jgi:hypothetical protein
MYLGRLLSSMRSIDSGQGFHGIESSCALSLRWSDSVPRVLDEQHRLRSVRNRRHADGPVVRDPQSGFR